MSAIVFGCIGLAVLFILLAFGMPIGLGMAAIGFAGLLYFWPIDAAIGKIVYSPFQTVLSYDLSVIPLFILMAHIAFASGLTKNLFDLAAKWLGHQRGGIAMATVGACAAFAAVSASSVATAATMGLVAIPEMKRFKYDESLATGAVAAGGTIGILIPPSSLLIIYGVLTETSIGKLFMGGLIPGILEALFYLATIYILCKRNPLLGPRGPKISLKEKVKAFGDCGEIIALVILVLGGLIIGWFTPTEAGAVGACGALVFTVIRGRLNWAQFRNACLETMQTTGMIFFILIGAIIFNYFLTMSTIPAVLADTIEGLSLPPLIVMGLIILVYMLLGCFIDAFAMILLTIPIFFPLALKLGFDPIWFGIIIVRVNEMALITPPIGMNVYIIAGVCPNVPMTKIFKGILPFFIADICHVAMLLFFPAVVMFLPSIM